MMIGRHTLALRMGGFGVSLILISFVLQTVQYWVALLDVSIRFQMNVGIIETLAFPN